MTPTPSPEEPSYLAEARTRRTKRRRERRKKAKLMEGSKTMPARIQLSRRKGFDLQAESMALNGLPAVNVARPSKWGNPHRVGADETYYGGPDHEVATAEQCVTLFEAHLEARPFGLPPVETLRGRNIACWCALDASCHGDVLLRLANVRCEALPFPTASSPSNPNPEE